MDNQVKNDKPTIQQTINYFGNIGQQINHVDTIVTCGNHCTNMACINVRRQIGMTKFVFLNKIEFA